MLAVNLYIMFELNIEIYDCMPWGDGEVRSI